MSNIHAASVAIRCSTIIAGLKRLEDDTTERQREDIILALQTNINRLNEEWEAFLRGQGDGK